MLYHVTKERIKRRILHSGCYNFELYTKRKVSNPRMCFSVYSRSLASHCTRKEYSETISILSMFLFYLFSRIHENQPNILRIVSQNGCGDSYEGVAVAADMYHLQKVKAFIGPYCNAGESESHIQNRQLSIQKSMQSLEWQLSGICRSLDTWLHRAPLRTREHTRHSRGSQPGSF